MSDTRRIEWSAVGQAAVSGVFVLVPLAIANQTVADGRAGLGLLFSAAILFVGGAIGYAAARLSSTAPGRHGALAAAIAYLFVQGLGAARRLVVGEPLSGVAGYAYLALLMATVGLLGASLAGRTNYRRP